MRPPDERVPVAELVGLPGPFPPGPPSSAARARGAGLLLWLTAGVFAFGALVMFWGLVTGSSTSLAETPDEPMTALQGTFLAFACLNLSVVLPTAVLFLLWLHRARSRQRAFGSTASPRWSVLVWFIPVLSVVAPYTEMQDLFAREEARPTDRNPLLGLWWACLIASGVLGIAGWVVQGGIANPSPRPTVSRAIAFASYALLALAAALAARFIGEFERRTARRCGAPSPSSPA
jgi:hypothetical protein